MTVNTPLHATFAGYLLLMVGIGFLAWQSTQNFDDYILGGRSLSSFVTALSAGALAVSGWLLTGVPTAKVQSTHQQVLQILREQGY